MNYQGEDEDVILQQSPLDHYLETITSNSVLKYSTRPNYAHGQIQTHAGTEKGSYIDSIKVYLNKVREYLPRRTRSSQNLLQCCSILLNSENLLHEEEETLLIDLKEELEKLHTSEDLSIKYESSFINTTFCCSTIFLLLLAYLIMYWISLDTCWMFYTTFVLSLISFIYLVKVLLIKGLEKDSFLLEVQMFSELHDKYNVFLDKVISHIREVDVIGNGYSYLKNSKLPFPNKTEKCQRLRQILLDGLNQLFLQLRDQVRTILTNREIFSPLDYKEEYVANLSLDSFVGIMLSSDENDINEIMSLTRLKGMVTLYRLQLSEFIYLIIVSLFVLYESGNGDNPDSLYPFNHLNKCIKVMSKKLDEELTRSIRSMFPRNKLLIKKDHKLKSFEDILHSSRVHLHAALARVEDISAVVAEKEMKNISVDNMKYLSSQFSLCIENAKYCIEEITEQIHPTFISLESPVENQDEMYDKDDDDFIINTNPPPNLGDMLYEGESEIVKVKSSDTNVDIADTIKESKDSRRVMKELKTILSVKESPVGLMSFPLQRFSDIDSEGEYSCGKDSSLPDINSKDVRRTAYEYNPDTDYNDEDVQPLSLPSMEAFRLPGILKGFEIEEITFGGSSEEELNE